jgi:hypothetical protein
MYQGECQARETILDPFFEQLATARWEDAHRATTSAVVSACSRVVAAKISRKSAAVLRAVLLRRA